MPVFYRHPVDNPVITGRFKQWYGTYEHRGIDYGCPPGTMVYAPADGTVYGHAGDGSFGTTVALIHIDGTYTIYAHLSQALAFPGQMVTAHQQIGLSGNTGKSTGPHLHWQLCRVPYFPRDITLSIDPLPLILEGNMDPRIDALRNEVDILKAQMNWVMQLIEMPFGLKQGRNQAYSLNEAMMQYKNEWIQMANAMGNSQAIAEGWRRMAAPFVGSWAPPPDPPRIGW